MRHYESYLNVFYFWKIPINIFTVLWIQFAKTLWSWTQVKRDNCSSYYSVMIITITSDDVCYHYFINGLILFLSAHCFINHALSSVCWKSAWSSENSTTASCTRWSSACQILRKLSFQETSDAWCSRCKGTRMKLKINHH